MFSEKRFIAERWEAILCNNTNSALECISELSDKKENEAVSVF
jgi:hypothetical protein